MKYNLYLNEMSNRSEAPVPKVKRWRSSPHERSRMASKRKEERRVRGSYKEEDAQSVDEDDYCSIKPSLR
jgi:hypothetical protein